MILGNQDFGINEQAESWRIGDEFITLLLTFLRHGNCHVDREMVSSFAMWQSRPFDAGCHLHHCRI